MMQLSPALMKARHFTPTFHTDTYAAISPYTISSLSGKAVLITGASKGIGASIAVAYAQAGAGRIALAARSSLDSTAALVLEAAQKAAKSSPPPEILKLNVDVSDESSVRTACEMMRQRFGRLDILVNNAGFMSERKSVAESRMEQWWATWQVNVLGPYLVTKYALPLMTTTKTATTEGEEKDGTGEGGTIVNVSSLAALFVGANGGSAYNASKFAISRFTEFVHAENHDKGIVAYSLHPGTVPTDMSDVMGPGHRQKMTDTPELAADTIVWLSQEKREWLGGRFLSCNWDMLELLERKERIVEEDLLKFGFAV